MPVPLRPSLQESMGLLEAIRYAASELGLEGSELELEVVFENLDDEYGYSCMVGEDFFLIGLNRRISYQETIRTLFHEMAHVKQQYDGIYVVEEGVDGRRLWGGNVINLPYEQTPWEIDAEEVENHLYTKWVSDYNMENIKWKKMKNLKVVI